MAQKPTDQWFPRQIESDEVVLAIEPWQSSRMIYEDGKAKL